MKLMTFVGATMFLVLTACDPTPPVDTASAIAYLGNRITNDFAFDNVAVSLSPVTDIDPNGDCTFAEGTVNGQSTRFLVEDPVRMCPKGSTYRTCSLTTLASTGGMNATRDVQLEMNITWRPTTKRPEQLNVSVLSIVGGRPRIAAQPLVISAGTDGLVRMPLVTWRGGDAIALTFRILTQCDGTGVNQNGTSTFGVTSARLVQD
jgi:hypothetical protein